MFQSLFLLPGGGVNWLVVGLVALLVALLVGKWFRRDEWLEDVRRQALRRLPDLKTKLGMDKYLPEILNCWCIKDYSGMQKSVRIFILAMLDDDTWAGIIRKVHDAVIKYCLDQPDRRKAIREALQRYEAEDAAETAKKTATKKLARS